MIVSLLADHSVTMRLFSIFSLIIFTLCALLVNGKFYQPKRKCGLSYDPKVDDTPGGCKGACDKACEENCEPAELCKEFGADFTRTKTKCLACICPEPI